MTTLVTATEVAALVVGVGGASVAIAKGVKVMRTFARFMDSWFGDGTSKHPSVVQRLDAQDVALEELKTTALTDLAELKDGQTALQQGQAVLKTVVENHVDTDVTQWRADGQAWGERIDARLDALELRTTQHPEDPQIRPSGGSIAP